MSKVSFLARWGIVFGVLGFFTLYSAAALGVGSSNKAYADAIKHNNSFRHSHNFVVVKDEGDDKGGNGHGKAKARMICAIDQNQLDALKASFTTAVYTTTSVDGDQKGIVEVDKTHGVNKRDVYQTIGIDKHGPKCQLIKTPQSFFLFLLPGVS